MKILISNDDGVFSPGIAALADAASAFGEVTVVAPHRERSTSSHSLTFHKPLRIHKVKEGWYSTTGTPADCIYLGIREILKEKPGLILSGINHGANLGTDVHYSGTVAAAREGALLDIPSYAFSMVDLQQIHPGREREPMRFETGGAMARKVLEQTRELRFPSHTLINVNVPNVTLSEVKGIEVARQGFRFYSGDVTRREDPRGKAYYWLGGAYLGFHAGPHTDCHAIDQGYVSVTPLAIDCTHEGFYAALRETLDKEL